MCGEGVNIASEKERKSQEYVGKCSGVLAGIRDREVRTHSEARSNIASGSVSTVQRSGILGRKSTLSPLRA